MFERKIDGQKIRDVLAELIYLLYADYFKKPYTDKEFAKASEDLKEVIEMLGSEDKGRTALFMDRILSIRELLNTDLDALYDGDPAAENKEVIIIAYPGFYAITVYRIAHELRLLKIPLLPRILSEIAHSKTGIDINPGATIGPYFFIDHGTGIVIGETTIIDHHVKLYQGVTLGALSTRGGQNLRGVKRHPTIGDNVTIYAGASVLGDVLIGRNSVIGSNVFITKDIEENSRVSMLPQTYDHRIR